jgi:hypothetical protein
MNNPLFEEAPFFIQSDPAAQRKMLVDILQKGVVGGMPTMGAGIGEAGDSIAKAIALQKAGSSGMTLPGLDNDFDAFGG